MLLQHAWLVPLVKPETITEEDEEEAEAAAARGDDLPVESEASQEMQPTGEAIADQEVADWVKATIEKRRRGLLGKGAPKPALHAAPLDAAVGSPVKPDTNGLESASVPNVTAEVS
jgi:mitogen-activated protein kinase kinase